MLRKLYEEYIKAGMEINFSKTEYQAITEEDVKNLGVDDNLIIRGCKNFKYLGFTISINPNTEEDIKCRQELAFNN